MNHIATLSFVIMSLFINGCSTFYDQSPAQKRQGIQSMKNEVLTELYSLKPDVKGQISKAPGYAVFSNANVNVVLASFGGGYGVVKNNKTAKQTYMKMAEVGIGFGLGVKDFRLVLIFHNTDSMQRFIDQGWAFGAQADAAIKASDNGAAVGAEATVDNISIYQLTKTGLALQATIKGTKFWKDDELN